MEKYVHTRRDDQRKLVSQLSRLDSESPSFRQTMAVRVDMAVDDTQDEQKSLWRGDHSFSSDAAKYSLLNFIEPEVEAEHPEWSKSEIRKTALARFEQRLAQDLSYEKKESDHVESAVHWRIVETVPGHRELATEYGGDTITLKTLWDHTREYAAFVGNTEAYNSEEEKAQLAMEQAFVKGDTQAYVSVLSHPDAVRYVQVWERESNGDVVSKQIDLYAATGRDFSHSEGDQLIQHIAQYEKISRGAEIIQSEAQYAHFMVKDVRVAEQDIRTIAILGATRIEPEVTQFPSMAQERFVDMPQKIVAEGWAALSDLTRYVSEEVNKNVDALRRSFDESIRSRHGERPTAMKGDSSTHARKPHQTERESVSAIHRGKIPSDFIVSSDVHEQKTVDPIKSVLSEWVISKTILSYVQAEPKGSGAAIFWMSYLVEAAKSEPMRPSSTLGLRERLLSLRDSIYGRILGRVFNPHMWRQLRKENRKTPIRLDRASTILKDDAHNDRKMSPRSIRRRIEGIPLVRHVRTLMRDISKKIWRTPQEARDRFLVAVPDESKSADRVKEKDIPIYMVGFAVLYWLVLIHRSKEIRHDVHLGITQSVPRSPNAEGVFVSKRTKRAEKADIKEMGSPWILFGIIWHLAMIRESASVGLQHQAGASPAQSSTLVTQNSDPVLPLSGIIYMFSYNNTGNMNDAFVVE